MTLTVNQAVPVITWPTPAAISYGTALSATQLDATANVAGTFTYSPAVGAVLAAGSQTLSVTFTPANTTNYTTATASVALTVNQAAPYVTQLFASTQLVYPGATNVTVCVVGTKAMPTGSIQIDAGSTVLTTLSLQGNGCGYWYISPGLNAGTYSITSVYSGDSNNPRGTSAPTVLTVSPVPVNMSASCWNASFPYGTNYQCTVNVSSNAGSAQGNITYSYDSGAPVAVPLSGGSGQFTITAPRWQSECRHWLCATDQLCRRATTDRELHGDSGSCADFARAIHLVHNGGDQHHVLGGYRLVECGATPERCGLLLRWLDALDDNSSQQQWKSQLHDLVFACREPGHHGGVFRRGQLCIRIGQRNNYPCAVVACHWDTAHSPQCKKGD